MIRNLQRVEHCASSEVVHLFQKVGCVRNKFQFRNSLTESGNHLFGRWIEIRRYSRSRFVGSDCFCPWKHGSDS